MPCHRSDINPTTDASPHHWGRTKLTDCQRFWIKIPWAPFSRPSPHIYPAGLPAYPGPYRDSWNFVHSLASPWGCIFYYLVDIFTWKSHGHFKVNLNPNFLTSFSFSWSQSLSSLCILPLRDLQSAPKPKVESTAPPFHVQYITRFFEEYLLQSFQVLSSLPDFWPHVPHMDHFSCLSASKPPSTSQPTVFYERWGITAPIAENHPLAMSPPLSPITHIHQCACIIAEPNTWLGNEVSGMDLVPHLCLQHFDSCLVGFLPPHKQSVGLTCPYL